MNKQELLNRTKQFGLDVIKLVGQLPSNPSNKIIISQLIRSGTSIGANYRSALRAKSRADFIYKIKLIEEESDESLYWLELLKETNVSISGPLSKLIKESNELTAIFTQIGKTSKKNKSQIQSPNL